MCMGHYHGSPGLKDKDVGQGQCTNVCARRVSTAASWMTDGRNRRFLLSQSRHRMRASAARRASWRGLGQRQRRAPVGRWFCRRDVELAETWSHHCRLVICSTALMSDIHPTTLCYRPTYHMLWTYPVYCRRTLCNFLANVNLCSSSLYAIAVPYVVCLSVTLVHFQPVEIFGNFSSPSAGTLAIHWRSPSVGGFKREGLAKYSDFCHLECYNSESVQDRR